MSVERRRMVAPLARPERLVDSSPVVSLRRSSYLFEDPDFPANSSVLYAGGPRFGVVWKRPFEIEPDPVFIDNGLVHFDIDQGELGDCWFLASVACIAASPHKDILTRVIPQDQDFGTTYSGKFRFNFWYYGEWKEVVVDDRLPTYNDKLIYSSNRNRPNEFWGPLLEKAFAKLYGSYNVIDGGRIHTALTDLTGGLGELVRLKQDISDKELSNVLLKCFNMNSIMGGAIFSVQGVRETRLPTGLLDGHAYSIVNVKQMSTASGETTLLHLRNPHGRGEWNGPWSDGSKEWKYLTRADQAEVTRAKDDGEFWISVSDFRQNFDELEMCHMTPDALTDEIADNLDKSKWKMTEHRGSWLKGVSAGGPPISFMSERFWSNPQVELHVESNPKPTTLIISLFEIGSQVLREENEISIGFSLFRFPDDKKVERINVENFYLYNPRMVESSGVSWPYREKTARFTVEAGEYVIVPYTSQANQTSEFYMRVFAEHSMSSSALGTLTATTTDTTTDTANGEDHGTVVNGIDASEILLTVDKAFDGVADGNMTIGARELREVFIAAVEAAEGTQKSFEIETCRCLIGLSNVQSSKGLVDKKGVRKLWGDLTTWRQAFQYVDKDHNQMIDTVELQKLFNLLELRSPTYVMEALMKRYGGLTQRLSEDDFLQSVCKIVHLKRLFLTLRREGKIIMDLDEFIVTGLSI